MTTDYLIAVLGTPPDPPPANPALITEDGTQLLTRLIDGAELAGDSGNLVWDPSGTRKDNVYTAWDGTDGLAAAIAALEGQKVVTVNGSGSPTIPAGTYPGITDVTFIAGLATPLEAEIAIDDGATFTVPSDGGMRITLDGCDFVCASTSQVIALAGSDLLTLVLKNDAQIIQTGGGGRFLHMAGTSDLFGFLQTATLGANVIAVQDTPTLDLFVMEGSSIVTDAIQGLTGNVGVQVDAASLQGLQRNFASGGLTVGVTVLDPPSTLAIDPAGAAGSGIYVDWDALMFARSLINDPVTIFFYDDTHMTTVGGGSPWNFGAYTILEGFATLTIDQGATFKFAELHIKNLTVVNASTVSPAVITSDVACYVDDFANVTSNAGAAAIFDDTAAGLTLIIGQNATVGDGTHAVLKSETASGTAVQLTGLLATLKDNALSTGAGGGITIDRSPDSVVNTPLVQNSATITAYTFRNVVNTVQTTGNGGTGTHTVTVTTGNIAQAKSGKVMVTGSCAGTSAAADTITATLVRDVGSSNVTIATQTVVTTAGQLNYSVSFSFLDTLPNASNHTYSIRLAGSQNNTVAANQGIITAIEQ